MTEHRKPKDYLLAEAGYVAFYERQAQIPFDLLAHAFQMRWVQAARSITIMHDAYKRGPNARTQNKKPKRQGKPKGRRAALNKSVEQG